MTLVDVGRSTEGRSGSPKASSSRSPERSRAGTVALSESAARPGVHSKLALAPSGPRLGGHPKMPCGLPSGGGSFKAALQLSMVLRSSSVNVQSKRDQFLLTTPGLLVYWSTGELVNWSTCHSLTQAHSLLSLSLPPLALALALVSLSPSLSLSESLSLSLSLSLSHSFSLSVSRAGYGEG